MVHKQSARSRGEMSTGKQKIVEILIWPKRLSWRSSFRRRTAFMEVDLRRVWAANPCIIGTPATWFLLSLSVIVPIKGCLKRIGAFAEFRLPASMEKPIYDDANRNLLIKRKKMQAGGTYTLLELSHVWDIILKFSLLTHAYFTLAEGSHSFRFMYKMKMFLQFPPYVTELQKSGTCSVLFWGAFEDGVACSEATVSVRMATKAEQKTFGNKKLSVQPDSST